MQKLKALAYSSDEYAAALKKHRAALLEIEAQATPLQERLKQWSEPFYLDDAAKEIRAEQLKAQAQAILDGQEAPALETKAEIRERLWENRKGMHAAGELLAASMRGPVNECRAAAAQSLETIRADLQARWNAEAAEWGFDPAAHPHPAGAPIEELIGDLQTPLAFQNWRPSEALPGLIADVPPATVSPATVSPGDPQEPSGELFDNADAAHFRNA